jgi:hypothetical protein
LAAQFAIAMVAAAVVALELPGLPALYGAAAAAMAAPAMYRALLATVLGVQGSWPVVSGTMGALVIVLTGVAHLLVRSSYVVERFAPAKGEATADAAPAELPVAAAAA